MRSSEALIEPGKRKREGARISLFNVLIALFILRPHPGLQEGSGANGHWIRRPTILESSTQLVLTEQCNDARLRYAAIDCLLMGCGGPVVKNGLVAAGLASPCRPAALHCGVTDTSQQVALCVSKRMEGGGDCRCLQCENGRF